MSRPTVLALAAPLALALALGGCACSDTPDGTPCASRADCADNEMCTDGRCAPESTGDAGGADASGLDASRGDAGPPRDAAGDDAAARPDAGVDASCGGEAVDFSYAPPNVLIVFDRSCSMRQLLATPGSFGTGPDDPATRWFVAREAVLGMLARFDTRAFWGLMAFPDPREGCGMPVDAEVLPAAGTRAAISATLATSDIQPFGLCGLDNSDTTTQPRETPTLDALESARMLTALSDPARASFVILVTDGGVSCGVTNEALGTLAAGFRTAGIPVGVIGFATGGSEASLEAIAAEGGLVNPAGPPSYYVAEDRDDLDAVLDTIAERVVPCEFALASTPPEPVTLFVNVNDVPLAEDATNGWSYDATGNALVFAGEACRQLRAGEVRRLAVSFGCPPSACVPEAEVCNALDDDCDDDVDEDCLM